jgi:hypothetical protein
LLEKYSNPYGNQVIICLKIKVFISLSGLSVERWHAIYKPIAQFLSGLHERDI